VVRDHHPPQKKLFVGKKRKDQSIKGREAKEGRGRKKSLLFFTLLG